MGIGAAILAAAVMAVIAWLVYLVTQARVARRREAPPQNLTPYMTDDELESKRLNSTLVSALITTAVISVVMPIYFLNETDRQAAAEHHFEEIAVERGHEWWLEYECWRCHGEDGNGGGAPFVETRSGISTVWAAPSLNDILYRYTPEETRFWIVYGRQGTPMPAWGTEGGGPLNSQQIDELVAYIASIQLPQQDVLAKTEGAVTREIARIEGADDTVAAAITAQEEEIAALEMIPSQHEAVAPLPGELRSILTGSGTCTPRSARLYATTCRSPGNDSDRDGISDEAEIALNDLLAQMIAAAPPSDPRLLLQELDFDPDDAFTTSSGVEPIPDLEGAEVAVTEFASIARDLRLTNDNLESLLATAEAGLAFLQDQASSRAYAIDLDAIADAAFGGDTAIALRAAALYNAYCARCHTAGYSAGTPFTQQAGSGAFGPALFDGRSIVQFPDIDDHVDFVVRGSENAIGYGANGIGRGWMPGFGAVLTQADLDLIVAFERALP